MMASSRPRSTLDGLALYRHTRLLFSFKGCDSISLKGVEIAIRIALDQNQSEVILYVQIVVSRDPLAA